MSYTPKSLTMLYTVSLINSPALTGATFPGRDNAHIVLSPSCLADSKSTPAE